MTEEAFAIGSYVYVTLAFVGIVIGGIGFTNFVFLEKNYRKALLFIPIIMGAIISGLLFASTFGELVW